MARADAEFRFTQSASRPILAAWILKSISENYQPALIRLDEFVSHPSDPQAVIAIYKELAKSPAGKSRAAALLSKYRPAYADPLAAQLEKLLKP